MSQAAKRLFTSFQPENYELFLHLSADKMTFSGQVIIKGQKVGRPSQRITLHQKDLVINSATIIHYSKKDKQQIEVSRINRHNKFNEVRLHTGQLLMPGPYTISLDFQGRITPDMQGIYPCNFIHNGQAKVLLATQFESHHAREAFPCIDEPEAKAIFTLSLATKPGEQVLSNTPVFKQIVKDGQLLTTFEQTPRMSTYLLAFVTGEMHSAETTNKNGVTVRSWAVVARPKSHLNYATKETSDTLDFFADYFGIPYPLPKLDQVALPDFDAGAMENWGLMTFRETVLLADPENRSISGEQVVSMVIAHEVSHQWFGNLVTMKWWDDLWLNESFAGLMEHIAPDALHPDWQQWELYAASDIALITSRDSYKNIQPVGVDVSDPDLIETLFDPAIVYAKGARLIKMLREYIGEEAFIKGLKSYFADHAYGNATRHDLWMALGKASGKDIDKFMTPWLTQPGLPVVHVDQNGPSLSLRQERFLLDGSADDSIWPIPLLAKPAIMPDVLNSKSLDTKLKSPDYVLLNEFASGQYITHYVKPAHQQYLAKLLSNEQISTEARINLLNDMYMLARHGDAPLTDSLKLVVQCSRESRDSVWALMARALSAANQLTEGDKNAEQQLNDIRIKLAASWYDKLGWDDQPKDDANTKQLRHTMVALMIGSDYAPAISEAQKCYEQAKSLDDINAELRATILSAVVRTKGRPIISKLLKAYPTASPDVQGDITGALCSTKQPDEAKQILSTALGEKGFVRDQDIMRWIAISLRNHHIREVSWQFMEDNWDWLHKRLVKSKAFDYLPTYTASVINTEAGAKKYHDFFQPREQIKPLKHNILLGYADITARVAWRQRDEAGILTWLKNQS